MWILFFSMTIDIRKLSFLVIKTLHVRPLKQWLSIFLSQFLLSNITFIARLFDVREQSGRPIIVHDNDKRRF